MPGPKTPTYRAFLSYSHADKHIAERLHRRLERFRVDPALATRAARPLPASLRPIFRDREEATAGGDLATEIETALSRSEALILLCSPSACRSAYVNEEVRYFKWRCPERPIIPVIVGGKKGDPERECFPPALRFEINADGSISDRATNPLAADLAGESEDLVVSKTVAGLLGVSTDAVHQRELRRLRRNRAMWISGMSAVLAVVAALAVWSELNRQRAEHNLAVAKELTEEVANDLLREMPQIRGVRTETVRETIDRLKKSIDALQPVPTWRQLQRLIWKAAGSMIGTAYAGTPDLSRTRAAALVHDAAARSAEGDMVGMEAAAAEAVTILRALIAADPKDIELPRELSVALNKVGEARFHQRNIDGAVSAFNESLAIMERYAAAAPASPLVKRDLYVPLVWLGDMHLRSGRLEAAQVLYTRALQLVGEAQATDLAALGIDGRNARRMELDRPSLERERAVAMNKLGDALAAMGRHVEALSRYSESLELRRRLAAESPDDALLLRQVLVSLGNVGTAHYQLGDSAQAVAAFAESVRIGRQLLGENPSNQRLKQDLSVSLNQLGAAHLLAGRIGAAREAFAEDLALTRDLAAADPGNGTLKEELATSLVRMAEVSLAEPADPRRACLLLTEAGLLREGGVSFAPQTVAVTQALAQVVAAAGHRVGRCN